MIPMQKLLACYNKLADTLYAHCKEYNRAMIVTPLMCKELADNASLCAAMIGETCFLVEDGDDKLVFFFNIETLECVESYYNVFWGAMGCKRKVFHMKVRS